MSSLKIIAFGFTALALAMPSGSARGQDGSYATASLTKPTTVTISGGAYNYDFLSDRSFPFGALRLGRDVGRYLVVEGGAQLTRLSATTPTAADATTFRRVTFPQTTLDGTLQFQVPVAIAAPYAGIGIGYYHLASGGTIQADNGLSRVGLVGVRVAVSQRALLRLEMRGRSDQHRGGDATDVEFGGGLGFRF